MSPQSSTISYHRYGNVNSCLSNIVHAADEAYSNSNSRSANARLDSVQLQDASDAKFLNSADLPPCPLTSTAGGPRFALRKRKVSVGVDSAAGESTINHVNSDFLSGLFADLSSAVSTEEHYVTSDEGESCPGTPVPSPRKKARISPTRSLARCSKSYASLAHFGTVIENRPMGEDSTRTSTDSYVENSEATDDLPRSCQDGNNNGPATASRSPSVPTTAAKAKDMLADTVFPHLPATVSDSFNPSADLSAQGAACNAAPESNIYDNTPVEPEQDITNTAEEEEEDGVDADAKDGYGWFLALDDNEDHSTIDAYAKDPAHGSSADLLAFQAPVSAVASHSEAQAEVEWAKAADTIDDVLGDFF
mmetsp:Transcript_1808/g.3567  ORF Transcript_1808/g.3567 Transcript_1808/m.3567 type:complete len:363 (+) Transcript_1808:295-1383(+)